MNLIWKFLTSLRLTVACLAFGIVLVWVGTVAQADEGLYIAQERYFKQWWVLGVTLWGKNLPIMLPGGYLIGVVLLVNLITAHIKRFQWGWKKVGIHLTHAGIVVMLLGQLVTDMAQVESHLRFGEGETKNFTEDHKKHELIFARDVDGGKEEVVAIPEELMNRKGATLALPLPAKPNAFEVRVKDYGINSQIRQRAPMMDKGEPPATQGSGAKATVLPQPEAKSMDARNLPYAVIEVVPRGAAETNPPQTWLVSPWLADQEMEIDGQKYRVGFRSTRYYFGQDLGKEPFQMSLLKTTHEIYPGTATASDPQGIPKNFQSRVRLENAASSEKREADIFMNNPLRYQGLTFYQYQMGRDEMDTARGTSTLQVVRNPSWLAPYIGCIIVGIGMTWQFMYHLVGFVRKRTAQPLPA
jgi:hypothetical protein